MTTNMPRARVEYLGPSKGYKATIIKHGPAYFLTKPEIQDALQGLAVMAGPYDVTEYALDPGKPARPVEPRRIGVNVTCVQAHQLQAAAVIARHVPEVRERIDTMCTSVLTGGGPAPRGVYWV